MFGSSILEVAIGMMLIYLVFSLIMTSVQEAVHALLNTRARNLQQAVVELLQGDDTVSEQFYNHPLIFALHRGTREGGTATKQLPSYIPRETFSAALIDVIERKGAIEASLPETLRKAYQSMERAAQERGEAVRTEIERWYDAAMDRASGRFKRQSQYILFLLAISVVLVLNVNSITLAQYLAVSPEQRQLVTELAKQTLAQRQSSTDASGPDAGEGGDSATENAASASPEDAEPAQQNVAAPEEAQPKQADPAPTAPLISSQQINQLNSSLQETGLPIGWRPASIEWLKREFPDDRILLFQGNWSWAAFFAWITLILGYLMTAFAITLGAPFWFDVLNKFMVIRGTVKPKEKSPDEASEDRQQRPRTQATDATR